MNLELLKKYKNIRFLGQFGFAPIEEVGDDQIRGTCPFCYNDKFFINHATKAWDCKKGCLRSGGYKKFIYQIVEHCNDSEQVPELEEKQKELAKNRGLLYSTIRKYRIGYNPANDTFILPIMDQSGANLWDVRIYDGSKLMGVAGGNVGLFGWHKLNRSGEVYLCEGEWDALALWQVLQKNGRHDDVVIAVAGAGTFKDDWAVLLKDRTVHVLYDHDEAGQRGSLKVYEKLKGYAETLSFIHWPPRYSEGFDVRDLCDKMSYNDTKILKFIDAKSQELPQGYDGTPADPDEETTKRFDGDFVSHEEIYNVYRKWLHIPDTRVIDIMFAVQIANRLDGDPLWFFLVAPSGATKTELLMSLSESPRILTTTSLTPQTLISGANFAGGGDPSLLPKLNQKVMIIKDFTAILNMHPASREEIFGILRDAYDGKCEKSFGTGVTRSYDVKFGIMAGVTPTIEMFVADQTAFGERFLRWRVDIKTLSQKREYLKAAQKNINREVEMRRDLLEIAKTALSFDYTNPERGLPELPEKLLDRIIDLAQFVSMMRGTVFRDKYTKEMTHAPMQELGTRLVKQFKKLAICIALFRGVWEVDDDIYNMIVHVARSSIPSPLDMIVERMYTHGTKPLRTKELADLCRVSTVRVTRLVEDLSKLDIVDVETGVIAGQQKYSLKPEIAEIVKSGGIYGRRRRRKK